MKEGQISRREAMIAFALGAGALATGCRAAQTKPTQISASETSIPYSTVIDLPTATSSPAATETEIVPLTDEQMVEQFSNELWRAGGQSATLFEAIPIVKDAGGNWVEDKNKQIESWYFDGVDFRIADVVGGESFSGFVSGVTGDKRMYRINLATKENSALKLAAQPIESYVDPQREIISSYMYISGESIYLNKAHNLGQTCRLLLMNMLEEPIAKNGGEFSMLGRIDAAKNFFDKSLYLPGYATGYSYLVPAGGACGIASSTARTLKQAEFEGWGRQTEGEAHSHPTYLDLPFGGSEDSEDVTVFYHPDQRYNQDLKWVNESDRDLWLIPRISYYPFELKSSGYPTTAFPCPVRVAISISLSLVPPTADDLRELEGKLNWLGEYVKDNYGGYYQS